MISPNAEIVELEPEGFARISEVLSHRVYAAKHEIHILHLSGEVLNVVDTGSGFIDLYRESFTDATKRAEEILRESEVDRVILVDKNSIGALQTELVELGKNTGTQTELLWRAHDLFFNHPAVAVSPPLPESIWPAIFGNLAALGEHYWAVIGAWKGDELFFSLIARVHAGVITTVVSADRFGLRPTRAEAVKLVEEVEKLGPVALALLCDIEDLVGALGAEDPLAELAQKLDRSILHRGMREVIDV